MNSVIISLLRGSLPKLEMTHKIIRDIERVMDDPGFLLCNFIYLEIIAIKKFEHNKLSE